MYFNSKTIPVNTIYNAILYYKNRSGVIQSYALVIDSESHEWKASSSKTSTRGSQVVVPYLEHHQDSISIAGKFLSQVDRNDFARFIRLWHKHSIGATFVPLTFKYYKFTDKKSIGEEINHFDCAITSSDIGANLSDNTPSFNISLLRLSDDGMTINESLKVSMVNKNMPYYDKLLSNTPATPVFQQTTPVDPDWNEYGEAPTLTIAEQLARGMVARTH